ncbi:hypothetical protein Dshi_2481 [Dinoroseobacter shibae DFL 12 = DSM 16493]|jgi:hypothetical protein|uniref:Uncharacterized protein n=1 Tax=Dinoroseobacter shibae (strain DSM 16493 / NCIMB 14021 / DFL 12) TaxID=398580 RepID=A8LSL6_DINSH|nr:MULTISPECIES: hypothetical protein [Dinoroseobacter]ABV94215.1 hypothetical protein Dshi_2481 [Dinoroseobacter shibae DFL 12 = DSM 16493]MDD9716268.1 hypothetical protein [Dinoroseobacter sp. PD6]
MSHQDAKNRTAYRRIALRSLATFSGLVLAQTLAAGLVFSL